MKICVLPGEGIGPEVVGEAVRVLQALPMGATFFYGDIGYATYQKTGTALPQETIQKVAEADATLFGAVTTPPHIRNYSSPILQLRRNFDLYANVRPAANGSINLVTVRENTEGMYSGIERVEDGGNRAITERVITRRGSERIIRYAFQLAKERGYTKVTVVHKANVLRETCGLFRKVALEIAEGFPAITMEEMLVDACAMQLIKNPGQFQVLVTTNLFGDILSDEAAMLTGGLGVAYAGNIGESTAIFEPVHGSAPKYVGTGKSNPIACIRAAGFMLAHLGLLKESQQIEAAAQAAIAEKQVTPDLGGNCTTKEVTEAIIHHLEGKT